MERTFWYKQTADNLLFPELLWSRPENKRLAGKLLIVGGNLHGFAAVAEAYTAAEAAGIGTARVVLPGALQKTVGSLFPEADFLPSTPSGSFSRESLAGVLNAATWANGTLLAGDLGRNSETAIMLERFVDKYSGQLTITKDTADYFLTSPTPVLERPQATLVISFAQLQKLAASARFSTAFTFDMDLLRLVDALHAFTSEHSANIVTKHLDNMLVAAGGQVSTTKLDEDIEIWRVEAAAHAAVWWLQNPSKPFEALSTTVALMST